MTVGRTWEYSAARRPSIDSGRSGPMDRALFTGRNSSLLSSPVYSLLSGKEVKLRNTTQPGISMPRSPMSFQRSSSFNPLSHLAKIGTAFECSKGQIVFSQGDAASSVFYVQKGRVKLSVLSSKGKEAIVAILGADSFFGEGCLRQVKRVRMATCHCDWNQHGAQESNRGQMARTLHEQHIFSDFFIRHRLLRNISVQEDLIDQLFNSTEKRLARALLLLAHYGNSEQPTVDVPKISQETLAEMIGTTRARVSIFMNKFKKLGFIDYNGGLRVHTSLLNVVLHE